MDSNRSSEDSENLWNNITFPTMQDLNDVFTSEIKAIEYLITNEVLTTTRRCPIAACRQQMKLQSDK